MNVPELTAIGQDSIIRSQSEKATPLSALCQPFSESKNASGQSGEDVRIPSLPSPHVTKNGRADLRVTLSPLLYL